VGVAGRRWLVVHENGIIFLLGPGAEGGVEQECSIGLGHGDSPWRLSNTASSEIHNWALTTREGNVWEISFFGGELNARHLNSSKRREWGSWISSLFVSTDANEKVSACCSITNNFWLIVTDKNVLRAVRSFPEESSSVWESEVLTQSGVNAVVDIVFNFRLGQLYVLREKEAAMHVYRIDDERGEVEFVNSIGLSAVAEAKDSLTLSESGNVIVKSRVIEATVAATAVVPLSEAESLSFNDTSMSTSVLIENAPPLTMERIEQISNELCGVFANDLWLVWAEKVNNVAFEKVGQILRSRVVKHRALFVANSESRLLADNNAAIAATHGFFLGWNELLQSGEEEDQVQKIKGEIVGVIGASIGPSNTRRLAARNIHLFSMLWSCCPVITHVLDLLKKFSSPQVFCCYYSVVIILLLFFLLSFFFFA
jgi:hypothetical protein